MKNLILGAGPAGLIAAYHNPEYKIVDSKPLGQLNLPFIPGPRLLQATDSMKWLVKSVCNDYELKIENCVIGYNERLGVYDSPNANFKKQYSMKTRGHEGEGSHLSEGKTEIQHIEFGDFGEDSYKEFFQKLLHAVESRGQMVRGTVEKIDTIQKKIVISSNEYSYENIISTLNLKLLSKLSPVIANEIKKYKLDLSTLSKCFYKCDYGFTVADAMDSKHPSLTYDYIYSIDTDWTRCTYFKDYIVYESVKPIDAESIDGNKIDMKFENLPIQIKYSEDIDEMCGIKMLGRFAQWNHKVKANEVLDRVEKWID